MNENLQNALVEILNKAVSGIDSSVEFMQAELPDVIEQLLMWYAVKGLVCGVVGSFMLIASLFCLKKISKKQIGPYWEERAWSKGPEISGVGFASSLSAAVIFMCSFPLLMGIMTTIKIWIAPKIWLMEYAANLVK